MWSWRVVLDNLIDLIFRCIRAHLLNLAGFESSDPPLEFSSATQSWFLHILRKHEMIPEQPLTSSDGTVIELSEGKQKVWILLESFSNI